LQYFSINAQDLSYKYIGPRNADVKDFCITAGNRYVFTAVQNRIVLYDILTGEQVHSIQLNNHEEIFSIALSPDSTFIVAGTDNGNMIILNFIDESQESIQISNQPVTSVAINRFGSRIASGTADGEIILTDILGGSPERLKPHEQIVTDIEFSSDGTLLMSSGMDGRIIVTDLSGELDYYCLTEKSIPCRSIAINDNMSVLVAAYDDGAVYQWRISSNHTFKDIGKSGLRGWATGVDFNHDDRSWTYCSSAGRIGIVTVLGSKYTAKIKGVATRIKFCYLQDPQLLVLVSAYQGGLLKIPGRNMKLN
jgi:WD40 repeat protein